MQIKQNAPTPIYSSLHYRENAQNPLMILASFFV